MVIVSGPAGASAVTGAVVATGRFVGVGAAVGCDAVSCSADGDTAGVEAPERRAPGVLAPAGASRVGPAGIWQPATTNISKRSQLTRMARFMAAPMPPRR